MSERGGESQADSERNFEPWLTQLLLLVLLVLLLLPISKSSKALGAVICLNLIHTYIDIYIYIHIVGN